MIEFRHHGDFSKTEKFLKKSRLDDLYQILNKYGIEGVSALSGATPVESGQTASSWGYQIVKDGSSIALEFTNSNINKGVPIAIILQYGHGTGTGGYVSGRDYINPAIQPVFDRIFESVNKEVSAL